MKLFLLSQTVNRGYDTYDSCVVAAESAEDAVTSHPDDWHSCDEKGFYTVSTILDASLNPKKFYDDTAWCHPKHVTAQYLGEAKEGTKRGVICASFNAG